MMNEPTKIAITGASGFVGRAILGALQGNRTVEPFGIVRAVQASVTDRSGFVEVGDIEANTNWSAALVGQHVVIHCAARAHIMKDEVADPLAEYRRVNVNGTLNLARQAARAGVRRFVFISSIKVNGEATVSGQAFTASDTPAPDDPYGGSKLEAEQGLRQIAKETGMEVVIIRPPLVYGPGVKGNFKSLMALASKNLPLPLGAIHNQRSLVGIDNLVDLVITCVDHPAAANQTFLVSDDHDLSTTELLKIMTKAAGKRSRLLPVPAGLLRLGAALLGKKAVADRLLGNLQVDITRTKETLGWQPPVSVEEGIKRCFE